MKNLNWLFNMFDKRNNVGYSEYDPTVVLNKLNMPKSRCEILRWVRIYFNTDLIVNNIVQENAALAMSTFELITPDVKIGNFYKEMAFNDNFNLNDFMKQFSLSYHKFGEAIPFGNKEEGKDGKWKWTKFILLEPELVEVVHDYMIGDRTFELIPTEELKELANDSLKSRELDIEIVTAIKEHRNIRLNTENVSMVARITDPSATRGTSPIQSAFKIIACMDDMRINKKGSEKDWEYYKNQLSLGLKVNSAVSRSVRDQFENWILNHYFKPIAEKNGFKSKGKLILPTIKWIR